MALTLLRPSRKPSDSDRRRSSAAVCVEDANFLSGARTSASAEPATYAERHRVPQAGEDARGPTKRTAGRHVYSPFKPYLFGSRKQETNEINTYFCCVPHASVRFSPSTFICCSLCRRRKLSSRSADVPSAEPATYAERHRVPQAGGDARGPTKRTARRHVYRRFKR